MQVYEAKGETETFRFIDWNNFSDSELTLPIDKVVANLLKNEYEF